MSSCLHANLVRDRFKRPPLFAALLLLSGCLQGAHAQRACRVLTLSGSPVRGRFEYINLATG